jgi:hypothetical protein
MSGIRRTADRMLAALQIEQTAIEKSTPRAEDIRRADSVRHLSGEGRRYTFRTAHRPESWQSGWVLVRTGKDQPWLSAEVESTSRTDEGSCEVRTMMQYLRSHAQVSHAQVLPVTDLIPIPSAAELAGPGDAERGCPAFFPVDEVIPAIEWDISRARERLDLFCPFLNARATKRWIGPLG